MKGIKGIILVLLLSVAASVGYGQAVVLDVSYQGVGMVAVGGKHVYLRVFENGTYEYLAVPERPGRQSITVKKLKLEDDEFRELVRLLEIKEYEGVANSYRGAPTLDHAITLTLVTNTEKAKKEVSLVNFFLKEDDDTYPKSLLMLLCKIEKLRKVAQFSFASQTSEICEGSIKGEN